MFELDPRFARHALKFVIFGALFIYTGIRYFAAQRIAKNIPLSKIGSMAAGLVHVKGTSGSNNILIAPFSGKKVDMYMVSINKRALNTWIPSFLRGFWEEWYLTDGSRTIKIQPNEFEFLARRSYSKIVWPWTNNQGLIEACRDCGFDPYANGKGFFKRFFQIEEFVVESGDSLEIVADAVPIDKGLVLQEGFASTCRIKNLSKPPRGIHAYAWAIGGLLLVGLGVFTFINVAFSINSAKEAIIAAAFILFIIISVIYALTRWKR